jgi:hypothetical protein
MGETALGGNRGVLKNGKRKLVGGEVH